MLTPFLLLRLSFDFRVWSLVGFDEWTLSFFPSTRDLPLIDSTCLRPLRATSTYYSIWLLLGKPDQQKQKQERERLCVILCPNSTPFFPSRQGQSTSQPRTRSKIKGILHFPSNKGTMPFPFNNPNFNTATSATGMTGHGHGRDDAIVIDDDDGGDGVMQVDHHGHGPAGLQHQHGGHQRQQHRGRVGFGKSLSSVFDLTIVFD